jgi:deoxyribose-phosphate aldolase
MSAGLTKIPLPTCVRNDVYTKNQTSKANPVVHASVMDSILKSLRVPIKISGNITDLKSISGHDRASLFAVNLSQAKNIVKEFKEPKNE